ncbi:MAG: transposase [Paracoccaceae bacterium]|jgi:transposase|nr:transposase [Paracoccaceae bacterium]
MALQGDAGATRQAYGNLTNGLRLRMCVAIDPAKVTHVAVAVDDPVAIDGLAGDPRAPGPDVAIGLDVVGAVARVLEAVLLGEGSSLVHTPGITARSVGPGFSGRSRKSDPRDESTIAQLMRTRDLRRIRPDDGLRVPLRLEVDRRSELIQDHSRRSSRLRGLPCGIRLSLGRILGPSCSYPWRPLEARQKIAPVDRDFEALLAAQPDSACIHSLPGMGAGPAAEFIDCVGCIRRFGPARALTPAVGRAPVHRQPGMRAGWRRAYGGGKAFERACYRTAVGAVTTADPLFRGFHDRKRQNGKHCTEAVIALVWRRVTAIWSMLGRREAFYTGRKAA